MSGREGEEVEGEGLMRFTKNFRFLFNFPMLFLLFWGDALL